MKELTRLRILYLILLSIFVGLIIWCGQARAHEDHGWSHLTDGSGPLIGMRECGMGMQSWYHDDNGDGVVDRCSLVLYNHGLFHAKPARMTLERGIDGVNNKIGCTCEPVKED